MITTTSARLAAVARHSCIIVASLPLLWRAKKYALDPADVAAASEAPPDLAAPGVDAASPGRSHSFSKPRESLNAELARDDAATAESLAAAAASRASGLAGELQLRREVVMMPA